MKANGYPWRVFGVLLICAVCGVAASFPFVFSLYADLLAKSPVPLPVLILLGLLQNSVILALVTGFGLFLTAKVGLPGAPFIEGWLSGKSTEERFRTIVQPALIMGVGVGATLASAVLSGPQERATATSSWEGGADTALEKTTCLLVWWPD